MDECHQDEDEENNAMLLSFSSRERGKRAYMYVCMIEEVGEKYAFSGTRGSYS